MRRYLRFVAVVAGLAVAGPAVSDSTVWFEGPRLRSAGQELVRELVVADRRGLASRDYDAHGLQLRLGQLKTSDATQIIELDAALSAAAARIASDLNRGRVLPSQLGYDLDLKRPVFDAAAAVSTLASSSNVSATLDAFEPRMRHYALLKVALARYRSLAATSGGLTNLPPPPRGRVRQEETYSGVPMLRQLLVALGDLAEGQATESADASALDASLSMGLKAFQARHGLEPDGVLGSATFRALTTPFTARVQQIELSLERMRWLPPFDVPPLIVNIPQFRLFAFRTLEDSAEHILQMDVIVGEAFEGRRTPVFAADMRFVVLQPYWDVPRSILVNELLPNIRKDAAWLSKHGYEIVRGAGDDARPLPPTEENVQLLALGSLRLRQRPGPANALGHVKFMFPNRHNVYLHDTPGRALFSRSRRAFSHGCIRVSDPMALLAHVLRDDAQWNDARRDEALSRDGPTRVPLAQSIPVFILYGTALASEDGTVRFFEDLYEQDAPLLRKLAARSSVTQLTSATY